MEDEVDVDIEGDEFESNVTEVDGGCLVQEPFTQSAWKSSAGILPWELDSSLSPENREVIKKMLLEEQYYLTGEKVSNRVWASDASIKPKARKSPVKTSSSASAASSRWSKQEKELFEEGLVQFGRRWTRIAKMVGSRSVLQVKSYARQYFKHKAKPAAPCVGPVVKLHHTLPVSSHASTLTNTVHMEKLYDEEDEEVDITDDVSNDGDCDQTPQVDDLSDPEELNDTEIQTDNLREKQEEAALSLMLECRSHTLSSSQSPQASFSLCSSEKPGVTGPDMKASMRESPHAQDLQTSSELMTEQNEGQSSQSVNSPQTVQLRERANDGTDFDETEQTLAAVSLLEEEEEEEEELKAPEQEIEMDKEIITDEEKQAIPEFFEGRPSKTPERYIKIRNYILDQWLKIKPRYLTKTSVRPGLKNCGDVNCIGRIHTYLELVGAINFSCEQAVYNRPKMVDRSKNKEGKDMLEAYQLAQRLQSMRTRKRRVRDEWGNWCNAKDLEGQTYEHLSAEEVARQREEMRKRPKPCKMSRVKGSFDPFQLIPCRSFGEDVQEPFQVVVCAETLLIMDMHAHVSRGEVIGLLGGIFNEEERVLKITAAEPCNSVSTGLQCEMDPVSQTQACDVLSSLGFSVVGWYHSHPSFNPNPSVRDINTQDQFQSYFSRGGAPFIGMIVSPYDPANPSPHSQTTCLLVKESKETSGSQKLPYRFDFMSSQDIPDWGQTLRRAQWIIHKYSLSPGNVQMNRFFRKDSHLTCLEKMLSSLGRYLEPLPDEEGEAFLTQIQALFQSDFITKQQACDQEEGESFKISSKPVDSDELAYDQLISRGRPQEGRINSDQDSDSCVESTHATSVTSSRAVLHLGSVLSTEHDYLL